MIHSQGWFLYWVATKPKDQKNPPKNKTFTKPTNQTNYQWALIAPFAPHPDLYCTFRPQALLLEYPGISHKTTSDEVKPLAKDLSIAKWPARRIDSMDFQDLLQRLATASGASPRWVVWGKKERLLGRVVFWEAGFPNLLVCMEVVNPLKKKFWSEDVVCWAVFWEELGNLVLNLVLREVWVIFENTSSLTKKGLLLLVPYLEGYLDNPVKGDFKCS